MFKSAAAILFPDAKVTPVLGVVVCVALYLTIQSAPAGGAGKVRSDPLQNKLTPLVVGSTWADTVENVQITKNVMAKIAFVIELFMGTIFCLINIVN